MGTLYIIALSAIGVVADAFLKAAGTGTGAGLKMRPGLFSLGLIIYAALAIGWYFALKGHTLLRVGVIYGVSSALLLAAVSYFVFKEPMGIREVVGVGAGVLCISLLARHI